MPEDITKTQPAGETPQNTEEVKEQATVEAGEQPQEPQETPEFWLDEEGNLQGNFIDWGIEEEEQKEAGGEKASTEEPEKGKEGEEPQKKEEVQYYTPEELAQLELNRIDPARVPPELRPYYEAILRAEAQKKQEQSQEQAQIPDEKQLYDYIQTEARKRVEQKLGEPFDELNPKHLTALAVEAAKVSQGLERKIAVQQKINELRAQEPYFDQINEYIKQKLDDLPAREYRKIMSAIQNDDLNTFLPFWEKMRKEFYQKKLGKTLQSNEPVKTTEQAQPNQPAPEPPKVEGAGKGEIETPPKINPRDFAKMKTEEQAEALIKLGII